MITDESMEMALDYIRDQAAEYGRYVGLCKYLDHKRKVVRAQLMLDSDLKTVADRESEAMVSVDYNKILDEIKAAETEKATIHTMLNAAYYKIDCWRSVNSSKNKGHL